MLKRSLIFNLFLALLVVIGLIFLFFNSLDYLTNHGKETHVPALEGKNMKEAVKLLEKTGFQIKIDSTYQSYKDPLEVLFQEPAAGATVKVGRTIFLTVNRKTPPSIPMPNLVGISFRNAILTMQSFRLVMGDTIYKPDLATGSVLEQQINGKPIRPGMMVPIGSRIDLVIAEGFSGAIDVPNLVGMSWGEAKFLLDSLVLTPNPIWEGSITDSTYAIIYSQTPEAINELDFKNSINRGDLIDIRIMQNPSQELLLKNQGGSKKLLGEDEEIIHDSNEVPIATLPKSSVDNNEAKDTAKRKRVVPGLKVPDNKLKTDTKDPQDKSKTTTTDKLKKIEPSNKKTNNNVVNSQAPKKVSPPKKETPSKPVSPVKNSDDVIKNEYE